MDDIWAALRSADVKIDADSSPYRTDRDYARDLQASQTDGTWRTFYQAIGALERGCGYSRSDDIEQLCKKCLAQDDQKFLEILQQKLRMITIVVLLQYTDTATMLGWIGRGAVSNVNVLFECLRRALTGRQISESAQSAITRGLLLLLRLSPDRFRYLLQDRVLPREECVPVVRSLLPELSEEGWTELSACVSFGTPDRKRLAFWTNCSAGQDWEAIGKNAGPMLRAWRDHLERRAGDAAVWTSLYNDGSNLLIPLITARTGTPSACVQVMDGILERTEQAMYRWYERPLQQRGALFAGLSALEHTRYAWLNLAGEDAPPFPPPLSGRALRLILQWRHLWYAHPKEPIAGEIRQLTDLLDRPGTV